MFGGAGRSPFDPNYSSPRVRQSSQKRIRPVKVRAGEPGKSSQLRVADLRREAPTGKPIYSRKIELGDVNRKLLGQSVTSFKRKKTFHQRLIGLSRKEVKKREVNRKAVVAYWNNIELPENKKGSVLRALSYLPDVIGMVAWGVAAHRDLKEVRSENPQSIAVRHHSRERTEAVGYGTYYAARNASFGLLIAAAAKRATNFSSFANGLVNVGNTLFVSISGIVAGAGGVIMLPFGAMYLNDVRKITKAKGKIEEQANRFIESENFKGKDKSTSQDVALKEIAELVKKSHDYTGSRIYTGMTKAFFASSVVSSTIFSLHLLAGIKGAAVLGTISVGLGPLGWGFLAIGAAAMVGYGLYLAYKSHKKSNQEQECIRILSQHTDEVGEIKAESMDKPEVQQALAKLCGLNPDFAANMLLGRLTSNDSRTETFLNGLGVFESGEIDQIKDIDTSSPEQKELAFQLIKKRLFAA